MTASQDFPSTFEGEIDLGVIGGTGLYSLECLIPVAVLPPVETPWGKTSSPVTISRVKGDDEEHFHVAFIARHGVNHEYSPTTVPYRANVACMKRLKCKALLSFSAVGSLQHYIKPRDFTLPQQIIDRTKGIREMSFLNDTGLIGHVGFGNPFSQSFAEYLYGFRDVLENPESGDPCLMHYDRDLTVVCMEGPQFSTRAESKMYKMLGGAVINMSVLPEAKLARECELPYQIICMATDYDAWREELEPVTTQTVLGNLSNNAKNANALTSRVITAMAKSMPEFMLNGDGLKGTTTMSICTKRDAIPADGLAKFSYLFPEFGTD